MNIQEQIEEALIIAAPMIAEIASEIASDLSNENAPEAIEDSFFATTLSLAGTYGLTTSDKLQANAKRHYEQSGGYAIPAFFLADEWDSLIDFPQISAVLEGDEMLNNLQRAAYMIPAKKAQIVASRVGVPQGFYSPLPYLVPSENGTHLVIGEDGKRRMRRGVFNHSPTNRADDYIPYAAFAPGVGTVTGMLAFQKILIDGHYNWTQGTAEGKGFF